MAAPYNRFAVGREILERIKATCPRFRNVDYAQSVNDHSQLEKPLALVGFQEQTMPQPGQQPARGAHVVATQHWVVTVVVSSLAGGSTLDEAGELAGAVEQALAGWKPNSAVSSLYEVSGSRAFYGNGFVSYPLTFTTTVSRSTGNSGANSYV